MHTYTDRENNWTFRNRRSGHENVGPCQLVWEIHGDPLTDGFTPHEVDAVDLLKMWVRKYYPHDVGERLYGPGMVGISWFLDAAGQFEAPDVEAHVWEVDGESFAQFFTTPRNVATDEVINWNRVPVKDKLWDSDHDDKGGFFQQATGWKPSAFQPAVYLPGVLKAAGLGSLVEYAPRETKTMRTI